MYKLLLLGKLKRYSGSCLDSKKEDFLYSAMCKEVGNLSLPWQEHYKFKGITIVEN